MPAPKLLLRTVTIQGKPGTLSLEIKVNFRNPQSDHTTIVTALIDSGCTASVMDAEFAKHNNFPTTQLCSPMVTCNADGTMNANGLITHMAKVIIDLGLGHQETITCLFGKYETHKLMLRDDWLQKHNLSIDWVAQKVEFRWCTEKPCSVVHAIAHVASASPDWTTMFPQVFGQEYFDVLPLHRPGVDLDIKLEDGAKPYHSQLYPMPKAYHMELQKWINENLATG